MSKFRPVSAKLENGMAKRYASVGCGSFPENLAAEIREERDRRTIVYLVYAIYFLLLFEGVVRKWVVPQWGRPLFFVRDPLVAAVYALAFVQRGKVKYSRVLEGGVLFALAGLCLVVFEVTIRQVGLDPLSLAGYGWRNYFFNFPLAFIVATHFRSRDLARMVRLTLFAAIPMAILVIAQFNAPPNSPINVGFGDSSDEIYASNLVPGGFVRTSGTFTSNLGLTAFVASALAMAIGAWLQPRSARPLSVPWLLVATGGCTICLGLSGSRGAVLWCGLVLVGGVGGLFLAARDMGLKALAVVLVLATAGIVAIPAVFPQATDALTQRWVDAGESEKRAYGSGGVFGRAIYDVFSFRFLLDDIPPVGYGLGSAGNAAWKLGTRDRMIAFSNEDQVSAAESDWGRNVLELGPVIGCLFIVLRVALAVWLAVTALVATKRSGDPLAWLLVVFVGGLLFNGQITANGTLNGYAWIFAGFCMAACQRARTRSHSETAWPRHAAPCHLALNRQAVLS